LKREREREREKNQVERDSLVNEEGQINEIRTAQYALLRFRRAWKCSSYLSQFFFFISILVFVFGFLFFLFLFPRPKSQTVDVMMMTTMHQTFANDDTFLFVSAAEETKQKKRNKI
jgi:hypothetical protein